MYTLGLSVPNKQDERQLPCRPRAHSLDNGSDSATYRCVTRGKLLNYSVLYFLLYKSRDHHTANS